MRTRPFWVIAAVLVAIVAGAVAFWLGDDDGNVEVGDRLEGSSSGAFGHDVVVRIPYGRWQFTIAEPVEEVPANELDDDAGAEFDERTEAIRGPGGSSIIRVEATPDLTGPFDLPPPFATDPVENQPPPPARAALVVGGEDFDLGISYPYGEAQGTSVMVVVPGAADELSLDAVRLRIEVDGESPTVAVTDGGTDDLGAAATLYEPRPSAASLCPVTAPTETDAGFAPDTWGCEVSTGQYPYHPDLGWAGDGATWTWVSVNARALSTWEAAPGDQVFCPYGVATIGVQLADEMPDQVAQALAGTQRALAVFRTADLPPTLTLRLDYACPIDPDTTDLELPATLTVSYDITAELPWS